jgi:hypothetical protein
MALYAAETLMDPGAYRFSDHDAFLVWDDPDCDTPWITRSGLVAWVTAGGASSPSRLSDRLVGACSPACLQSAKAALAHKRLRWSQPVPIADWLAAFADSLDRDPVTTPIGEFAGVD